MPARRTPQRSCIACRTTRPQRELLRVARLPDGSLRLDRDGRQPGRGAYVCAKATCVERGVRGKILGRALRVQLSTADLAAVAAELSAQIRAVSGADVAPIRDRLAGRPGQEAEA